MQYRFEDREIVLEMQRMREGEMGLMSLPYRLSSQEMYQNSPFQKLLDFQ